MEYTQRRDVKNACAKHPLRKEAEVAKTLMGFARSAVQAERERGKRTQAEAPNLGNASPQDPPFGDYTPIER